MDKLDRIDEEAIEQTLRSRGYKLIEQRIRQTLDKQLKALRRDMDAMYTAKARGFLDGLESSLDIPRILIEEAKQAAKKSR